MMVAQSNERDDMLHFGKVSKIIRAEGSFGVSQPNVIGIVICGLFAPLRITFVDYRIQQVQVVYVFRLLSASLHRRHTPQLDGGWNVRWIGRRVISRESITSHTRMRGSAGH